MRWTFFLTFMLCLSGFVSAETASDIPTPVMKISLFTQSRGVVYSNMTRLADKVYLGSAHFMRNLDMHSAPRIFSQLELRPGQTRLYYFSLHGRILDAVVLASTRYTNGEIQAILSRSVMALNQSDIDNQVVQIPYETDNKLQLASGSVLRADNLEHIYLQLFQPEMGDGSSGAPLFLTNTSSPPGALVGIVRCQLGTVSFLAVSMRSVVQAQLIPVTPQFDHDFKRYQPEDIYFRGRRCLPVDSKKGGGG